MSIEQNGTTRRKSKQRYICQWSARWYKGNGERKFKHICESKSEIKFPLLVDCEVVAEGKTVAAPVQRTTRALNTTMSRYFLESFFHVSLTDIFLG